VDLEATWQQHKQFIARVGAGAVAFGILSMVVGWVETSAGDRARRNAKEQADVLHEVSGLRGQEAAEKGKKQALEEKARPAIESAVTFSIDPAYLLADDARKDGTLAFASARARVADEIGRKADKAGAKIPRKDSRQPELGFEEDVRVEGARAAEALARCDVTRQVVGAALDVGILNLLAVKQIGSSYEPLEGGNGFLRRIPVALVFEGTTAQLANLLAQFQRDQGGKFLELGACHVGRLHDSRPEEGRLEIDVELAALTIEKEAPPDAASTPGEPSRKSRTRRRD
jgi:hypothetical protein